MNASDCIVTSSPKGSSARPSKRQLQLSNLRESSLPQLAKGPAPAKRRRVSFSDHAQAISASRANLAHTTRPPVAQAREVEAACLAPTNPIHNACEAHRERQCLQVTSSATNSEANLLLDFVEHATMPKRPHHSEAKGDQGQGANGLDMLVCAANDNMQHIANTTTKHTFEDRQPYPTR